MILSAEQIKQIAKEIAFDVHQYIIEHQEEYQLFKQEEEISVHTNNNSTINKKGDFS